MASAEKTPKKTHTRIPVSQLEILRQVSIKTGRSVEWMVAQAIDHLIHDEVPFWLQEAEAAAARAKQRAARRKKDSLSSRPAGRQRAA
jgi:predicted DNA-binding protein